MALALSWGERHRAHRARAPERTLRGRHLALSGMASAAAGRDPRSIPPRSARGGARGSDRIPSPGDDRVLRYRAAVIQARHCSAESAEHIAGKVPFGLSEKL